MTKNITTYTNLNQLDFIRSLIGIHSNLIDLKAFILVTSNCYQDTLLPQVYNSMPKGGQDWPLVKDMVSNNQRLLVFGSVKSKEQSEGIAYQWNYMVENQCMFPFTSLY